jgi:DMSO/TMAO reductase YedYZ heme-binding membrane subunit
MLIVLGASSLCVACLETRFPTEALRTGQVGAEVLEHQRNLVIVAASTFVAATLLFATASLAWRSLVNRMQPKSVLVTSVACGLVYVLCSVWLIIAALQGARLADHLAEHARP